MAANRFDEVTKLLAKKPTRRQVVKGLGLAALGGVLSSFGVASADPRTCVTCACGTGKPCNVKSSFCTELRGFPPGQTCQEACAKQNQKLCGQGQAFHCPKGCP